MRTVSSIGRTQKVTRGEKALRQQCRGHYLAVLQRVAVTLTAGQQLKWQGSLPTRPRLRQSKQSARATPSHSPSPSYQACCPKFFARLFHIFTNFKEPHWSGGRFPLLSSALDFFFSVYSFRIQKRDLSPLLRVFFSLRPPRGYENRKIISCSARPRRQTRSSYDRLARLSFIPWTDSTSTRPTLDSSRRVTAPSLDLDRIVVFGLWRPLTCPRRWDSNVTTSLDNADGTPSSTHTYIRCRQPQTFSPIANGFTLPL